MNTIETEEDFLPIPEIINLEEEISPEEINAEEIFKQTINFFSRRGEY